MIDTFAEAYGWSKRQILDEIYPDEVPLLLRRIQRRKLEDERRRIMDKLDAIETALIPHRDPKKGRSRLPGALQRQLRRIEQLLNPERGLHFDEAAFARLKALKRQTDQMRRVY